MSPRDTQRLAEKRPGLRVQYQLMDRPVGPVHRSLAAAMRHLRSCRRSAVAGGDCQGIYLVEIEVRS